MLMLNELLQPLPKHAMGADVAEQMRRAILSGQLSPGQRLLEEGLAEMMHVSRGPIRDALALLEREGLIVKEPHRGTFVARLTAQDAEEVHALRLALELLAAEWAVRNAREDDLRRMEEVVRQMEDCVSRRCSEKDATDLDLRFHEIFVRTSRLQRVIDLWQNLKGQIRIIMLSNMSTVQVFRIDLHTAHQSLVELLRSRDLPGLKRQLEIHQNETFRVAMELLAPKRSEE